MKNYLASLCVFVFSSFFSQMSPDLIKYYHDVNSCIQYFVDKNFICCIELLQKSDPSFFFEEEKELYFECLDSIKQGNISQHVSKHQMRKFEVFSEKLKTSAVQTYLQSHYSAVDFGQIQNSNPFPISNEKVFLTSKSLYLFNIVTIDRYLSFVRASKIISDQIQDSLYNVAAQNTLNVFREIELPTRKESNCWNSNLMLAISHNLQSLDQDSQDELLICLKNEMMKGNIHIDQYAAFYDQVFVKRNENLSYYGMSFYVSEVVEIEPLKVKYLPNKIFDSANINTRRKELLLSPIELFYKYKNIVQ